MTKPPTNGSVPEVPIAPESTTPPPPRKRFAAELVALCALSLLTLVPLFPHSVAAQNTTPLASTCASWNIGARAIINQCGHNIRITGKHTSGSSSECIDYEPSSGNTFGNNGTAQPGRPAQLCVEYEDTDKQNETGRLSCDTVTIDECGDDNTAPVYINPDAAPSGNIELNPTTTLEMNEGDDDGTFRVKLDTAPAADVTVTITSADTDAVTVSPASLTFTTSNYNTERTVTVTAVQDSDNDDESVVLTLSASGGIIASNKTKTVSVDDDEPPSAIVVDPNTVNIEEGDTTSVAGGFGGSFIVKIEPASTKRVNVSLASNNSDVFVSPQIAQFSPNDNSMTTGITIGVRANQDADKRSEAATITLSTTSITTGDVPVTVNVKDDDIPSGNIVFSPGVLTVVEGSSNTFTVKLDTEPGDVTVTITRHPDDPAAVTFTPTSLTFDSTDYSTEKTVTVTGVQDDDNDDVASIRLVLRATGDIEAPHVTKTVMVDDDEEPSALVFEPAGKLSIPEGGSATLSIKIDPPSSGKVRLAMLSLDSDISNRPGTLDFEANDGAAQTVTLNAHHDADIFDDDGGDAAHPLTNLIVRASGGFTANVRHPILVVDDDVAGSLVMQPATLQIVEGGQESISVRLGLMPTVDSVTVNLTKTNPSVTLDPSTLTFSDENWNIGQRVVISVAEDENSDNGADTITGAFGSSQGNYASAANPAGASISIVTLDRPGGIVTSTELVGLTEGGEPMSFTVHLGDAPVGTSTVTLTLSNDNPHITLNPPVLLFTRDNFGVERTVEVQAQDDVGREDDFDIIHIQGAGGNYKRSTARISVSIEDNDDDAGVVGGTPGRAGVYALAIPPETGSDTSDLRIRCRQSSACAVYFDCTAQTDGDVFEGWLPELIPAWGTRTVRASDIVRYAKASWFGKGRLGCLLRSRQKISAQVWTRSGDGVLVNNSASLESALDSLYGAKRVDIESIPSPDGDEETNLRIRCVAPSGQHCTRTRFACFDDDGTRHEGDLGRIPRLTVRHLQTSELADLIDHRWEGMGLSCELRSDNDFTVQVMTRTGGGGALVNNSATGVVEE